MLRHAWYAADSIPDSIRTKKKRFAGPYCILSDGSCDAVKSKACANDVSEQHPLDDNPTSGLSEFLVLCLFILFIFCAHCTQFPAAEILRKE